MSNDQPHEQLAAKDRTDLLKVFAMLVYIQHAVTTFNFSSQKLCLATGKTISRGGEGRLGNRVSIVWARQDREQWGQAASQQQGIRSRGAKQDLASFSTAIASCERSGQWEQALGLLEEMQDADVAPDEDSFSSVIAACESGGQWERAESLLEDFCFERDARMEFAYSGEATSNLDSSSASVFKLARRAFFADHIINPDDRKLIRIGAGELGLGCILKVGWPGFLIVEGESAKVDVFVNALTRRKLQRFACRAEQIVEATAAFEADDFTDLRKLPLGITEFEEHDAAEFEEACKGWYVEDLFRAAMDLPPPAYSLREPHVGDYEAYVHHLETNHADSRLRCAPETKAELKARIKRS